MQRAMFCVHPRGPIGRDGLELGGFAHAKGKIDVGPAILAS
jgi:hypothetical protein